MGRYTERSPNPHTHLEKHMSLTFYWLDGKDGRRFTPFGWRSRMAVAHKGLEPEIETVKFGEKDKVAFSGQKLVPVLVDGDTVVADSWAIACYLEDAYPDRPALFGCAAARGTALFVNNWCNQSIHPGLVPLIVRDILDHVWPEDADYFRESREKRFGKTLEEVQANRDERIEGFRAGLGPLRATLKASPYLGGDGPSYADYIVFGSLMWPRAVSDYQLLEADDPIEAWFQGMLDLHGGLGRRALEVGGGGV
jgi:glutathione S-transferase